MTAGIVSAIKKTAVGCEFEVEHCVLNLENAPDGGKHKAPSIPVGRGGFLPFGE